MRTRTNRTRMNNYCSSSSLPQFMKHSDRFLNQKAYAWQRVPTQSGYLEPQTMQSDTAKLKVEAGDFHSNLEEHLKEVQDLAREHLAPWQTQDIWQRCDTSLSFMPKKQTSTAFQKHSSNQVKRMFPWYPCCHCQMIQVKCSSPRIQGQNEGGILTLQEGFLKHLVVV